MLRTRLPRISLPRVLTRKLHAPPPIRDEFKEGIPDFLGRKAIDVAWYDYQTHMVNRLNRLLLDHDSALETKDLLIKYARQPDFAPVFNYASMAHNNDFFFKSLSPEETAPSDNFKRELESSFSSMETLQKTMINTADAMFGPGFVWLVQKAPEFNSLHRGHGRTYALLTTYHAGSPYPGAHWRLQSTDMATQDEESVVNQVGSFGKLSKDKDAKVLLGGFKRHDAIVPLLCINTWEHVWLHDYKVSEKRKYAANWWKRIDWDAVEGRILK